MGDSLVRIRAEPLHTVQALEPDSHLEESWLCCALGILCPYCPSWPSSTKAGSGIQLCLHSRLSIAVAPRKASRKLQLPPPSFFFSSAHAKTESCQNRCVPESENCNWQGPCGSSAYNNFPVYLFIYISLQLVIGGFLIFIFPSAFWKAGSEM